LSNGLYFKTIELIFILFCNLFLKTSSINIVNTVKPVYAVTFINQSPNSPVLKGHLSIILSIRLHINWTIRGRKSYKDNLSLSQKWPLNTGLTVRIFTVAIFTTLLMEDWNDKTIITNQCILVYLDNKLFFLFFFIPECKLIKCSCWCVNRVNHKPHQQ
jgi:hypothetical protein